MPIAKFVNAQDIREMINKRNPGRTIGYHKACQLKRDIKEAYIKKYGEVMLYNENNIPLSWVLEFLGEAAFHPNKQKEKDA